MLHKNKCSCEYNECFGRSERIFQDKVSDWYGCKAEPKPHPCDEDTNPEYPIKPEQCDDMVLAMAYVKNQKMNPDTLNTCEEALRAGTLFQELDKPFKGGANHHE